MGRRLEAVLAVLNGAIGDYLERTDNGLATRMSLVWGGAPLPVERAALARAYPEASPRVVVLLHGLMCAESIWDMPGGDYGTRLLRDFGFSPVYLRYNSGLSIPDNGAEFAALAEALVDAWPVPIEELLLLGFSMGGLVARSAVHVAAADGLRWLGLVRRAIYVGTPHLGAPLERVGRVVARALSSIPDPYTRLAAQLGDLRSDGIKDLGDADLRHEDRARRRVSVALRDASHPVPLLPTIRHYLVAGALATDPRMAAWFGDTIVPMGSGTNGLEAKPGPPALPPGHVKVLAGLSHMTLAQHPDVYTQIHEWLEEDR